MTAQRHPAPGAGTSGSGASRAELPRRLRDDQRLGNHGHLMSWIMTFTIVLGFVLGGVGLVASGAGWLFFLGLGIVVVSAITAWAIGIMEDYSVTRSDNYPYPPGQHPATPEPVEAPNGARAQHDREPAAQRGH